MLWVLFNRILMKADNQPKPLIWNGQEFPSLEEMARQFKQTAQGIRYYLKRDKPFLGHVIDYKL